MMSAPHIPVLLNEVVAAMAPAPGRTLVDATFGAGGYTTALLEAGARVIALDRDPTAARFAEPLAAAYPDRFQLILRPFSQLEAALGDAGVESCDGVVFDLGVSSMQIDEAERGFSFMRDGPLDMRMGADGPTAADLVNTTAPGDLVRMFRLYGEENKARRIVQVLARRREETPFTRTLDLADTIEQAVGGRRGAPTHPATRVFQALRIAVNEELDELETAIYAAERVLAPGGRFAVVSFHSLEDRIVKGFLTERSGRLPAASRHRPPLADGPPPTFDLLFNGAQPPTDEETAANPRARSSKIRAAVRTAAPAWADKGEA
ncbi:MAG: 16S rRNA (cytosine(1402)-N(4))-methyltransferase RsmH [Caulobacteraceae bacterium]